MYRESQKHLVTNSESRKLLLAVFAIRLSGNCARTEQLWIGYEIFCDIPKNEPPCDTMLQTKWNSAGKQLTNFTPSIRFHEEIPYVKSSKL